MKTLICALLLAGTTCMVLGHDWGWGSCPRIDSIADVQVDQMLGKWYVIRQFDTSSKCFTYNIERIDDNTLAITKRREFKFITDVGISHSNGYRGVIDVSDPSAMTIKWDLNARESKFRIFAADYNNYLGIYDCQNILLAYRQNAALLSRTVDMTQSTIDDLRKRLEDMGVNANDFDEIDHKRCTPVDQADFNINIDKESAAGTFADAANTVQNAIQGVINNP